MNSYFAAQFSYCPLIWVIHGRFSNQPSKMIKNMRVKCELLPIKTKIIIKVKRATIPNGVSFWSWFKTSEESNLSWVENQSGRARENDKDEHGETRLLWFTSQLNNFEWFGLSITSFYGYFWVTIFYSRAKVKKRQNKKNKFYLSSLCSFRKGKRFLEGGTIAPNALPQFHLWYVCNVFLI